MAKGKERLAAILSGFSGKQSLKVGDNSKIYRDEPIIKTAAQMLHFLPAEYRKMRALARSEEAYRHSDRWLFYQQAKLMENFTDTVEEIVDFNRYFPTYQAMNDRQLRSYFSWRTKVRQGCIVAAPLSFVFVYVYELLHQIGVTTAEEGFTVLYCFWQKYRIINGQIDRYLKKWLWDYCIYYNVNPAVLEEWPAFAMDKALEVLLTFDQQASDTVLEALNRLSSYSLESSRLYKQQPAAVQQIVYRVLKRLIAYYGKNRKNSLWDNLFGRKVSCPYTMFESAVFYDRFRTNDREYTVNAIHRYTCCQGKWQCERYYGNRTKSKALGGILKAIDNAMRERCDLPLLKDEKPPKYLQQIIADEIAAYEAQLQQEQARTVSLDLSKLQAIRQAADHTRDMLIVEEEQEIPPISVAQEPINTVPKTEAAQLAELDEIECRFIQCLLQGQPYDELLRPTGRMVSLMVDAINEALWERFGDTVIEFDGNIPVILEDYREELKGLIDS